MAAVALRFQFWTIPANLLPSLIGHRTIIFFRAGATPYINIMYKGIPANLLPILIRTMNNNVTDLGGEGSKMGFSVYIGQSAPTPPLNCTKVMF